MDGSIPTSRLSGHTFFAVIVEFICEEQARGGGHWDSGVPYIEDIFRSIPYSIASGI